MLHPGYPCVSQKMASFSTYLFQEEFQKKAFGTNFFKTIF